MNAVPRPAPDASGTLSGTELEAVRLVEAECLLHWKVLPAWDLASARWESKRNPMENPYRCAAFDAAVATTRLGYGYEQVRSLYWEVAPETLTDADRLNGVQWKGEIRIRGSLMRNYDLKPKSGPPVWSDWKELKFASYAVIGRYLTKKNGIWESTEPFMGKGETAGTPGDPDAAPDELQAMHVRDANAALQAKRWQAAVDEAVAALDLAKTNGPAPGDPSSVSPPGTPEAVLSTVLKAYIDQKEPDTGLANAAGPAAIALAQHRPAEARTLALICLRSTSRQVNSAALDGAVASFATVLTPATPGEKDALAVIALREYLPVAIAHRHGNGPGARKVAEALATLDNPEWARFAPFDPSAVLDDFKRAWMSRGEKLRGRDPIDRSSETMPLIDALFGKLGRPSFSGEGQRGLSFGTTYSVWVTGPHEGLVRGAIVGDKAREGDSYSLILRPDASGAWMIVGIQDVVLSGQPLKAGSPGAGKK